MRYRRHRHRNLTPAQRKIQVLVDRNNQRISILLEGIGSAIKSAWDVPELRGILDLIATDVIPVMRNTEALEKRLWPKARTRENSGPRKTVKKSAKNKKGKA